MDNFSIFLTGHYCVQIINALAKYTTYVIGKDISNILNSQLLVWDKWYGKEKKAWLRTRDLCGILVFILAISLSFAILCRYHVVLLIERSLILFLLWIVSCVVLIVGTIIAVNIFRLSKKVS